MKVGTDALILGSWAGETTFTAGKSPRRILDIGTGSGIVALMLAQRFCEAFVDAVELEPDAANQARSNASESPFGDRIAVHHRAIQGWEDPVDLAVCNPPFFRDHPKSPDRKRNLARHDDTLPLHVLFSTVKACLSPEGEFALVFPQDRAEELQKTAQSLGFHCLAQVQLRATPGHDVIRSLWAWSLTKGTSDTHDVWDLEGEQGQGEWSPLVSRRLAPFVNQNEPRTS